MIVLEKIISGGQTGADRAGLEVAKFELGLATGGWAPRGYRTERGIDLELRDLFGLQEHPSFGYAPRTRANVKDSDATVVFGNLKSPGSKLTLDILFETRKPFISNPTPVNLRAWKPFISNPTPFELRAWLIHFRVKVLNVAGNRASVNPVVGAIVKQTLKNALDIDASND